MIALDIEVVSDVVCPWCWVGKRRLERALAERPQIEPHITWRPFLLHPWLPPEGTDRESLYLQKFGTPRAAGELVSRIEEAGRPVGLDFRFDRIGRVPDSTAAHCVLRWALAEGPAVQGELVERLFRAYFVEGRNIARPEVLVAIAENAGLSGEAALEALQDGRFAAAVDADWTRARSLGVTAVPTLLYEGQSLVGFQPYPAFRRLITG